MPDQKKPVETRCGFIAIIGRPNVGKSTLLNKLIGEKVSITSHKPQTTRERILGIKTNETAKTQFVFVDTPGMHLKQKKAVNRYMNKAAKQALIDVDLVLFVVEALRFKPEDEWIQNQLQAIQAPIFLVLNKIDLIPDKSDLLPLIKQYSDQKQFAEVIPFSCKRQAKVASLEQLFIQYMPASPYFFDPLQKTDKTQAFLCAETVREKLVRLLGQELPYAVAIEIEKIERKPSIVLIYMIIWVERASQKKIIIGQGGSQIKQIGALARLDLEKRFKKKVHLQLWVKVRSGWSDDETALKQLGFVDLE